jgi:hypothetical protein
VILLFQVPIQEKVTIKEKKGGEMPSQQVEQ